MNTIKEDQVLGWAWPDGSYVINDDEVNSNTDITMAKGYQASDDFLVITGATTLSQLSQQMGKSSIDFLTEVIDEF